MTCLLFKSMCVYVCVFVCVCTGVFLTILHLKEKGATEDKMDGWHDQLNGHESEETPGDNEVQGSLTYCSPWSQKVGHDLVT